MFGWSMVNRSKLSRLALALTEAEIICPVFANAILGYECHAGDHHLSVFTQPKHMYNYVASFRELRKRGRGLEPWLTTLPDLLELFPGLCEPSIDPAPSHARRLIFVEKPLRPVGSG